MDDTPRILELRKKLEKDPGSRLFAQLAEELRKGGRPDEAIEVARTGLERNPNYPSARLTLARALLDSGRPAEARPELESIVQSAPDNILATRLLAEALDGLGETGEALRQFEQTLVLSPGDKGLGEKVEQLKARMSAPLARPAALAPEVGGAADTEAPPSVLPEAAPASTAAPEPEGEAPSLFAADAPSAAAVSEPSVPEVSVPEVSVPEASAPEVPVPEASVPEVGAAGVALDRDLASGTLTPGSFQAADLQKHFDDPPSHPTSGPSAAEASEPAAPALDLSSAEEMAETLAADEPPGDSDVGATTLPLNSVTLADLYLQQGLKAEASAVLSQVMKEEPENKEARSRLAQVSGAPAKAPRDQAGRPNVHEESITLLKTFLGAVEREALQHRATERGIS